MSDMTYKLECRICLEVPRPDELDEFGLCMEKGHVTCGPCYTNFKEEIGTDCFCSYCRKAPLLEKIDFMYVRDQLREMANEHVYNCTNCNHKFPGHALLEHEENCPIGKFQCPVCSKYVSPSDLMALKHPCMPTRSCYSNEKEAWEKILYLEDLSEKDSAIFMVHGGFDAKLCLSHKLQASGLSINVYWLDHQNIPVPASLRILIGLGIFTEPGPLFREIKGTIHTFDMDLFGDGVEPKPQLFVPIKTYSKWEKYSKTFKCAKCSKRKAHVHLIVDFV